jgi:hypothetical protein
MKACTSVRACCHAELGQQQGLNIIGQVFELCHGLCIIKGVNYELWFGNDASIRFAIVRAAHQRRLFGPSL